MTGLCFIYFPTIRLNKKKYVLWNSNMNRERRDREREIKEREREREREREGWDGKKRLTNSQAKPSLTKLPLDVYCYFLFEHFHISLAAGEWFHFGGALGKAIVVVVGRVFGLSFHGTVEHVAVGSTNAIVHADAVFLVGWDKVTERMAFLEIRRAQNWAVIEDHVHLVIFTSAVDIVNFFSIALSCRGSNNHHGQNDRSNF